MTWNEGFLVESYDLLANAAAVVRSLKTWVLDHCCSV